MENLIAEPMNTVTAPENPTRAAHSGGSRLRQTAGALVLLTFSIFLLSLSTPTKELAKRDFISYWSAAHRLIHHENPYDAAAIYGIERAVSPDAHVMIMRNSPNALFLVLPLGLLTPRAGYLFWAALILIAWLGSAHILRSMEGRPDSQLHFAGYFFPAGLSCFYLGQTSAFLLLGVVLFLRFWRERPYLGGLALALCAMKPQLFFPFAAVLLVWIVNQRAYKVLLGTLIGLSAWIAVALYFDLRIFPEYLQAMRTQGLEHEFIPTLGAALRVLSRAGLWLEFIPAAIACGWGVRYFSQHKRDWDWADRAPLLLVVGLLVAPYAWFFDDVVVLPALFYALYRTGPRAVVALFALLACAGAQAFSSVSAHSAWYLWPSFAWFGWYLYATRLGGRQDELLHVPRAR